MSIVPEYSDNDILLGIQNNNNKVLEWLYKQYYPLILNMVKKKGGNASVAKDVFQEGILVVYRRLKEKPFQLTSTFKTFFYKVCQNIALKLIKMESQIVSEADVSVKQNDGFHFQPDDFTKDLQYSLYQKHFRALSNDCQRIMLMYLTRIPVQKIATIMGISVAAVKKRKYLCKENLLNEIKKDPLYKQLKNENEK